MYIYLYIHICMYMNLYLQSHMVHIQMPKKIHKIYCRYMLHRMRSSARPTGQQLHQYVETHISMQQLYCTFLTGVRPIFGILQTTTSCCGAGNDLCNPLRDWMIGLFRRRYRVIQRQNRNTNGWIEQIEWIEWIDRWQIDRWVDICGRDEIDKITQSNRQDR